MTDRRRNFFVLLAVAVLLLGSIGIIVAKKSHLGLDLKGGVELVYQAKPTKQSKVTGDSLNRAIDIMRQRVDQLGVSEPEITRLGNNQIQVALPAVKNAGEAQKQVGTTAQMYFYDWEPNVVGPTGHSDVFNPSVTGGQSAGAPGAGTLSHYDAVIRAAKRPRFSRPNSSTGDQYYVVNDKTKSVLAGPGDTPADLLSTVRGGKQPPGTRIVKVNEGTIVVRAESPDKAKVKPDQWYVLNDNPALRGTDITNPGQNFDQQTNAPIVTFDFTGHGRKVWQSTTRQIAQRGQNSVGLPGGGFQHFAIVLDNELISVPYIDYKQNPDGIDATNGSQIQGGFTIQSAQTLANLLKTGALPVKLDLISQSQVSATLGKQALHQGLIAGLVGFAVVAIFLLLFYRVLGLIAVGGLLVYGVYFYALIKLIPITLTLPGIAGLILTIGVAADANIVIFERVKEEARSGRSPASAIAAGYRKGLAAIIDANVVTFMTAFILFVLATAGVKGFAFTLGIGVLVSLFTAVLATSAVLGVMSRSRAVSHPRLLGATDRKPFWSRFDFMGASRYFFSLSGVILLIGALAIGGKGLNFGIDFKSGTRITATLQQPTNENGVRSALTAAGVANPEVQKVTGKGERPNTFQVSTSQLRPDQVTKVTSDLSTKFGVVGQPDTQSVGPTFGQTIAHSAIIAIIASLLVISVYIALRFEWKYAVPVLIALMHDLLITSGVYALTGREVTASTVAALLTILGYSLYDTIIVFDRIRENVPRMPRAAFSQIVNRSMSEVLTRSLATTLCTLLPVGALLLFGGETLKDFAFALLVGTISGAYSSVFIASPVLTHWKEREAVYEKRAARINDELGYVPAYATAIGGAPVDVAPAEKRARRRRGLSDEPEELTASEFQELVRELPEDEVVQRTVTRPRPAKVQPRPERPPAATEPAREDDGNGGGDVDRARDLSPDEVVMPKTDSSRGAPKRRNKRHGRR